MEPGIFSKTEVSDPAIPDSAISEPAISNPTTVPLESNSTLSHVSEVRERNWVPVAIAAALVLALVAAAFMMSGHSKRTQGYTSASAAPDPYAANLAISNLAMSESSNLAGFKVTYLDGHISNDGDRTVTGVLVQVIFRDYANKVAQTETIPMTLVRMREPYIDTETVAAAPLKPHAQQDFRLNFDTVSADWAGAVPELRVLHVDSN